MAIAAWDWPSYFSARRKEGHPPDVVEVEARRRPTPPRPAKAAGLYMICTLSKHAAEAEGYADAMMLD